MRVFRLIISVDIVGQYVQNGRGEGLLRGAGEEVRRQENRRGGFAIDDLQSFDYSFGIAQDYAQDYASLQFWFRHRRIFDIVWREIW